MYICGKRVCHFSKNKENAKIALMHCRTCSLFSLAMVVAATDGLLSKTLPSSS
jgi:hypothetical protein